ncbi:hypothetical protein, partial [Robertkochia marina]
MHLVTVADLRQRQRPKGRPADPTAPVHSPTVVVNAKKMNPKIKFTYLILALGLFSCKVLKESNTKILPEFSIQGKSFNELIVNRIPDYGLTGEDGCIVENQIKINLDN